MKVTQEKLNLCDMASKQITFKEGASLNRPPRFEGEHFTFWQKRMEIFIQSIDPGAWNAIVKVLITQPKLKMVLLCLRIGMK